MQLWDVRSLGRFGHPPVGEAGGGADHRGGQVRADPDGNHVLGHHLAGADAGVEAPGDDVGEAVVNDDLHLDAGVAGQQAP